MVTQPLHSMAMIAAFLSPFGGTVPVPHPSLNASNQFDISLHLHPMLASSFPGRALETQQFLKNLKLLKNVGPDDIEAEPINSSPPISTVLLETDGVLEPGDRIIYQDGSLYDEYEINGLQEQQIRIRLESLDFDPYLVLLHPNGDILAQNDDIAVDNVNSFLDYRLPVDGTYRVVANGFDRHSRGHYRLTVLVLHEEQPEDAIEPTNP
ncbi:MAG: hypothetical protein AAFR31_07095 [Cyanobacteria bacterium J06627_8]